MRIAWWLVVAASTALAGCSANGNPPPVRGVVLFVGDGMGVATVTASRIHLGTLEKLAEPASAQLALDRAPRGGLLHTWASDSFVTDSAAGITAMVAGKKVPEGALSADRRADGSIDSLRTLLEIAEARGWSTGIVTTTRITHATPAGCYAHTMNRDDEKGIATALVPGKGNPRLGNGIEVLLGGGTRWFLPKGEKGGGREDGRDLLAEMDRAGYRVVSDEAGLEKAVAAKAEHVLGLFSPDHMAYEIDRVQQPSPEPSLADMTRAALLILERNPRGFFLLVEGGRIDHALHEGNGYRAVTDMLAMDQAVGVAFRLDLESHLVLVTADHDHVMVLAGYPRKGSDVFTQAGVDVNGKPYTSILFADGPEGTAPLPDSLDAVTLLDPDFHERVGVPLRDETHGGMDVPLYAFGPARYLDRIHASMENTAVFEILDAAILGR